MRTFVISLLLFLVAAPANACKCSDADAQAAERIAGNISSWPLFFAAYERYGHCDDGAIAEGFSESVVHLLASEWSSLPEAQTLMTQKPTFRLFVVGHLDASADPGELKQVAALTSTQCPASAALLCKEILGAANEP
jgi:hypothetical protein